MELRTNFVIGLTCVHCYYATDLSKCGATTQCPNREHCAIHEFNHFGTSKYHAGCLSTDVCEGKQEAPPNIFGRRKRQANTVLIRCCDTDLCNTDINNVTTGLPNYSQKPTNNIESTTTNTCQDVSVDCHLLIQHFRVCEDIEFALLKCKKSCDYCGYVTNIETPASSTVAKETSMLSLTTTIPNIETPIPNIETPLPNIETPRIPPTTLKTTLPNIETPNPNIETPNPNIETPNPNIETPNPNIETPNPNIGTSLPNIETPGPN